MYIVIHSQDPYLLARMATDLQMEGYPNDKELSKDYNPFNYLGENSCKCEWMAIYDDFEFTFHSHDCGFYDKGTKGISLTSSNYLSTLSFILKNK